MFEKNDKNKKSTKKLKFSTKKIVFDLKKKDLLFLLFCAICWSANGQKIFRFQSCCVIILVLSFLSVMDPTTSTTFLVLSYVN